MESRPLNEMGLPISSSDNKMDAIRSPLNGENWAFLLGKIGLQSNLIEETI